MCREALVSNAIVCYAVSRYQRRCLGGMQFKGFGLSYPLTLN